MAEFFTLTHPVARKQYICDQCGKRIVVGEKHASVAFKQDGEFSAYREHSRCRDAWVACIDHFQMDPECLPLMRDMESDEREWIKAEYPDVHERAFGPGMGEAVKEMIGG